MKSVIEYYNQPHTKDYRLYIFDCLEQAKELMGADDLLDALTLSINLETLAGSLEYIDRSYELHID